VRIESGQLGIRQQSVSIAEVIEDADALIGALLKQRRQRLQLELPEDLPRVSCDGPRLTQVFVNLLANASKFAPEDSTVRVGALHDDATVTAWVEDEGPGVPEIESGSVFDRFNRGVEHEHEPEPGGLGLGLWVVKSLVAHRGRPDAFRSAAAPVDASRVRHEDSVRRR
jgi:K+-sensing histidine kinase KdpD